MGSVAHVEKLGFFNYLEDLLLLMDGCELLSLLIQSRKRLRGHLADRHNPAHSPRFSFIT